MALNGSDSEEELLSATQELEKGGIIQPTVPEPSQSLQVVPQGNFGGAASSSCNATELPAVLENADVDTDTSSTSSDSSTSNSFALELPLVDGVAQSGEAAGMKWRRLMGKARGPPATDDEPPAAQADPNE